MLCRFCFSHRNFGCFDLVCLIVPSTFVIFPIGITVICNIICLWMGDLYAATPGQNPGVALYICIYIYFRANAHRRLRRTTWPSMSSQGGLESYWMRICCFGKDSLEQVGKAYSRRLLRRVFPKELLPIVRLCVKALCVKASLCKNFCV